MKKRILSLALALMMCLTLLPGTALAADAAYPVTGGNIYFDPATGTVTGADKSITEANIPSTISGKTVTGIGKDAFQYCRDLTSVTIPEGVTSIGEGAFFQCNLTSVDIPASVTSIGEGAFTECLKLTSVTIPDGVTSIGDNMFTRCYELTSVTIPDSVTSIGDYAFQSCYVLSGVTIPANVTSIGEGAFVLCRGLTSINIPASVTSIGLSAFGGCENLTDVYYGGSEAQWASVKFTMFDYETNKEVLLTDILEIGLGGVTIHYNSGSVQPLAYASTQNVLVDGKPVEFQCYALKDANGYDTNYIKVRDLAYVLNGTAAQFNVGWDGSVNLEKGAAYVANGSEMNTPFSGNRAYQASAAQTKVDGAVVKLESIVLNDDNGGGYTYYKLRDLGAALGFTVDWSAEKGVYIETK